MSRRDDLEQLIATKRRRLQKLKETEARYGYSVDPSVLLEIEDIETQLDKLQSELKALGETADSLVSQTSPSSLASTTPDPSKTDGRSLYHSCFISYSHRDEAFAEQLYADLRQNGVQCWYAPEDIRIGDKIRPAIDQSIRSHDKLLLILSENSIDSDWVEKEVETAFEEERKRKLIILFPIRLDLSVMETDQAWAADIRRTRQIGDFSRWQDPPAYERGLKRLLRDLKNNKESE